MRQGLSPCLRDVLPCHWFTRKECRISRWRQRTETYNKIGAHLCFLLEPPLPLHAACWSELQGSHHELQRDCISAKNLYLCYSGLLSPDIFVLFGRPKYLFSFSSRNFFWPTRFPALFWVGQKSGSCFLIFLSSSFDSAAGSQACASSFTWPPATEIAAFKSDF